MSSFNEDNNNNKESNWLEEQNFLSDGGVINTSAKTTMISASFNQDGSCLSLGTQNGFQIFHLSPFQNSVNRMLGKSLGKVEMLFRCNLIALVGEHGSSNSYTPSHRVLIWDDHLQKAIGELSFRQVVLSVKLRRDAIAVALRDRIYIYHLSDLSLRDKIYTTENPHGLVCLSTAVHQDMVLACPSVTDGHVRIELYGLRKTLLLEAHESKLRCMALTEDGTKLVTASIKGTVLRVFQVSNSTLIAEFRRGVERVNMTCLTWSWDHSHLACCSDKGTTHIFCVVTKGGANDNNINNNTTATYLSSKSATTIPSSSNVKKSSTWYDKVRKKVNKTVGSGGSNRHTIQSSISQIRGVVHPVACAFVPELQNTVAVAGYDVDGNGVLLFSDYSKGGEEAVRTGYHIICRRFDVKEEEDMLYSVENEGKQRRKRLLGKSPSLKDTSTKDKDIGEGEGKLYVGERIEVLENQMKQIQFDEDQEEGFLTIDVHTVAKKGKEENNNAPPTKDNNNNNNNNDKASKEDVDNDDDDDDDFQDTIS